LGQIRRASFLLHSYPLITFHQFEGLTLNLAFLPKNIRKHLGERLIVTVGL
jgi:hypothetical protein